MEKKGYPVHFRISDREKQMLNALCERLGTRPSEFLRGLVREKFLRVFPKYAEKKNEKPVIEEEELTPEQACEQAGGKVETVDGVRMCVIQMTRSMQRRVPLSKPELFKK